MIIDEADAVWAADEFINYFGRFKTIEDYIVLQRNQQLKKEEVHYFL